MPGKLTRFLIRTRQLNKTHEQDSRYPKTKIMARHLKPSTACVLGMPAPCVLVPAVLLQYSFQLTRSGIQQRMAEAVKSKHPLWETLMQSLASNISLEKPGYCSNLGTWKMALSTPSLLLFLFFPLNQSTHQ